jgi:hypothetical protein
MVAQIDEQQPAVIANAMAPAGQARIPADIAFAKRAAGMGAVAMHARPAKVGLLGFESGARSSFMAFFVKAKGRFARAES